MAYKEKSFDKDRSMKDSTFLVASFDLQKCLPTPYLRNGVAFYKRQLWTYNLSVYQTSTSGNLGTCFLWNETLAARGGQEIACCVRKFIFSLPKTIEILNLYSDSCSGQNRNIYMAVMMCYVLKECKKEGYKLKEINH